MASRTVFRASSIRAESDALKGVFASCAARAIPGRASAMLPALAVDSAKPPRDHHRTGDGEIRFTGGLGLTQPVPKCARRVAVAGIGEARIAARW
ncbi:MAG: hypothetical protein ACLR9W_07320 [Enterobacter hormaechei]